MDCELEITFKKKKENKESNKNNQQKKKKNKQLGIFTGGRSYSTQAKYFLRVWPFTGKCLAVPPSFANERS
jgi:hypothetical protein